MRNFQNNVPQNANCTLQAQHAIKAIPACDGSPASVEKFTRCSKYVTVLITELYHSGPNEEQNLLILLGTRLTEIASDHCYTNLSKYASIRDLIPDFKIRFGENMSIATKLSTKINNEGSLTILPFIK